MRFEVRGEPFDPYFELCRYQDQRGQAGTFGATASFVGSMRDMNDSAAVETMTLEHYAGMTEKYLSRIGEEARSRWDILDLLVIHRVGDLAPGDPIVLIAVWAGHRGPAFEACRYLIEELKSRAPFWKKERSGHNARWVERNSPGI